MLLDHHDRAVHDEAEVDGAEAHQVAGDAEHDHADRRPQHRQRNGERDEQAGAEAPQRERAERRRRGGRPRAGSCRRSAACCERARCGRKRCPGGRRAAARPARPASGCGWRVITSRAFCASEHLGHEVDRLALPFAVAAPIRSSASRRTSATSARRTGLPPGAPVRDDRHGRGRMRRGEGRRAKERLCPGAGRHASARRRSPSPASAPPAGRRASGRAGRAGSDRRSHRGCAAARPRCSPPRRPERLAGAERLCTARAPGAPSASARRRAEREVEDLAEPAR